MNAPRAARAALAALALCAASAALACGRDGALPVEVRADGTPVSATPASATPTATPPPAAPTASPPPAAPTASPPPAAPETATPGPAPTPYPSRLDPDDLRGFVQPVAGACLPESGLLMPNAPREYRNGVHEGVDIYPFAACAPVVAGTPVLAVYEGVVIRADLDYADLTAEQVDELARRTAALGYSDPETLDAYRGRQVWIDHGAGVVTRYAHLGSIDPAIAVGAVVARGQRIGGVGESGTPESVTAPGTELHLHYEVRIGDSFLGAGLTSGRVRAIYERLFGPE